MRVRMLAIVPAALALAFAGTAAQADACEGDPSYYGDQPTVAEPTPIGGQVYADESGYAGLASSSALTFFEVTVKPGEGTAVVRGRYNTGLVQVKAGVENGAPSASCASADPAYAPTLPLPV